MADIGENLRTVLIASTAIQAAMPTVELPARCTQNLIYQDTPKPQVWYGRSSSVEEVDLSGAGGLVESEWDIEVISDDLDEAQDIADAVKRFLNGKYGAFGTQTLLGCFVQDHNDEYVPKSIGDESGYNVAALRATLMYAST